jgi:hypothetical protein
MEPKMKQFWEDLLRTKSGLTELISEAFTQSDHKLVDDGLVMDDLLAEALRRTTDLVARHPSYEPQGKRRGPRQGANVSKVTPTGVGESASVEREAGDYPKFHREADKLVKISCSGKRGKKYRHTCTIDDVIRLASRIAEASRGGEPVKLRSVVDSKENGLMNHQVYAAVDWLKAEGLLKHDERGYALEPMEDLPELIKARFRQLTDRA